MEPRNIFVCTDYDGAYSPFWSPLGPTSGGIERFLDAPYRYDLVCFTGGADIGPELYGHENLHSGTNPERDVRERRVFEQAEKYGIPMTGICRGTQLITALSGGTMVQHLRRPHGGHRHLTQACDVDEPFIVTSAHHQMIVPGEGAEVYAWAEERLTAEDCEYDGELPNSVLDDDGRVRVTEAIFIPHTRSFGVQYHPEWMAGDSLGGEWYLNKIRELLFQECQEAAAGEAV